jgi:7,8-dihydropterin-6-yl-methyl-4-(beta-D-ribofuranosyl)aminobenzene 5'-phosphate synthase
MIMSERISLNPVDRVEILTVLDNYVDVLLRSTDVVKRPVLAKGDTLPIDTLLSEHGLSLLITVYRGQTKNTILFDTGYSSVGLLHNLDQLGIDLDLIDTIVLSHGHMDHTGGLYPLLDRIARPVTLVVHPEAFHSPRYFGLDDGRKLQFPRTLVKDDLAGKGVTIAESKGPVPVAENTILVTGEVERVTSFEKGLPNAVMEKDGQLVKDPISDDQGLVIRLQDKGLVVLSGCSHAGIVNTVFFAQKITGVRQIHAVMGGFHLSGPIFEPVIERTISELKKLEPKVIVPMHCTGWEAIQRFSEEFPNSFVLNSVGTTITLS